nr:hypothetical protein [Tanacetum cinerariifolium]
MHNNIMAASSRDRPPVLAPGRYPQFHSRFLRYVDTRPNGKALRKCILSGPYKPTTVLVHVVDATDDSLAVPEHTTVETPTNMSPENKAHFLAEKEVIHLIRQRSISLTTLAGMVKQYQNEVNEFRAEKLARNANPLALVATTQASQDLFYQSSRSHRSSAPSPKPSIPSRSHTSTRHKGKEIAKPITPLYETASEEDSNHEQAQRDKDMQKNLALIAKYFKKIYKPTNNNLRTSSNSKNKNVDTTLRYMAKIQEVPTADSGTDSEPVEHVQNDAGYNDDIQNEQNDVESDDERVALANLIANLKLDADENKKIQKQLKKSNTTLSQELKECKAILAKTSKSLGESISV